MDDGDWVDGEMITVTMALLIYLISDDVHIFDPDQKNGIKFS